VKRTTTYGIQVPQKFLFSFSAYSSRNLKLGDCRDY